MRNRANYRKMHVTASLIVLSGLVLSTLGAGGSSAAEAAPGGHGAPVTRQACSEQRFAQAEQQFLELDGVRQQDPALVSQTDLRSSAALYIAEAEKCFVANEGLASSDHADEPLPPIDDGGVWMFSGFAPRYVLKQPTKWGSPVPPYGTPAGTVTYSYMPSGLSFDAEGYGTSVAIQSLSTYSSCFLTDIANAFAAWSAVANIQFVQAADNGAGFDAPGAQADIRIGAHAWPSQSTVLAHAYYPPPNGNSAAGDVHFNSLRSWSCDTTSIDIGIVAMHEIGHSIGLDHQPAPSPQNPTGIWAVMNPIYNPGFPTLQPDDASGAAAIYGPPPPTTITISGNVGVAGTTLGYSDGGPQSATADEIGEYSFSVPYGWSGTVTPFRVGYFFTPQILSYTNATSDQADENYTATARSYADFDGLGHTDVGIYRAGQWLVKDQFSVMLGGLAGDIPVPGDYDGDGDADVAVYRAGQWMFEGQPTISYGAAGDVPVPGDYDGDGDTDIAIYRSGLWLVKDQFSQWFGGMPGDIPVPGDYNADGITDIAIYRSGLWLVKDITWAWYGGAVEDILIPGDYDADGDTDIALYRNGLWLVKDQFGLWYGGVISDIPVPGDYDGDGDADVAVYRDGLWLVKDLFGTWFGGSAGDYPLPAQDTNGDGDPYQ